MVDQLEVIDVIDYEPLSIITTFSKMPHLDHSLNKVNSTLDTENELYLESLIVLVVIPALCLVASLLVLLIYACLSCCCWRNATRRPLHKTKIVIVILTILVIAATVPGYYGNGKLHKGMNRFEKVIRGVDQILGEMTTNADVIDEQLKQTMTGIDEVLVEYKKAASDNPAIMELTKVVEDLQEILNYINQYESDINVEIQKLDDFDLDDVIHYIDIGEKIRFAVTTALQVLIFIFVVLPIPAMIFRWHCFVRLFNIFGTISLIVMGLFTALYLGISVGGCDFCLNPNNLISVELARLGISGDITWDFFECTGGSVFEEVKEALTEIGESVTYLNTAYEEAIPDFPGKEDLPDMSKLTEGLKVVILNVNDMITLIDCDILIQKLYGNILVFFCKEAIPALVFLFSSSVAIAFLLTILIWITIFYSDHNLWKKKKPSPNENDDTEELYDGRTQSTMPMEEKPNDEEYGEFYGSDNKGALSTIDENSYDDPKASQKYEWQPSLIGFDKKRNKVLP